MAELVKNVIVNGEWWGPAHGRVDPPAEVAEQITNPACWSDDEPTETALDPGPTPDPDPPAIDLDALGKHELLGLANARGVDVDKRWGEKRLREAISAFEGG